MKKAGLITIMSMTLILAGCVGGSTDCKSSHESLCGADYGNTVDIISAVPVEGGYYCADTLGSIDYYNSAGVKLNTIFTTEEKWTEITAINDKVLVVGKKGALYLKSGNEDFHRISCSKDIDLLCACAVGNGFIVGCNNGQLLSVDLNGQTTFTDTITNESILSVAYGNEACVGVLNNGQLLIRKNGAADFIYNPEDGYDACTLRDIIFTDSNFVVVGNRNSDSVPVALYSPYGSVWNMRTIDYIEGEPTTFDPAITVYSAVYDGNQVVLACDHGRMLILPDCPQCNKLITVPDESVALYAIATDKIGVFVAGTNQFTNVTQTDELRQLNISAITAHDYFSGGGILIDVRNADEYEKGHINGSINIPLNQLQETLIKDYPDINTVLIFYCSVGVRSSKAAKLASDIGYVNAYCLGAMDNWYK